MSCTSCGRGVIHTIDCPNMMLSFAKQNDLVGYLRILRSDGYTEYADALQGLFDLTMVKAKDLKIGDKFGYWRFGEEVIGTVLDMKVEDIGISIKTEEMSDFLVSENDYFKEA